MKVDFIAWERHHYKHLRPIWDNISDTFKGIFYIICDADKKEDFDVDYNEYRIKVYNGREEKYLYEPILNSVDGFIVTASIFGQCSLLGGVKRPIVCIEHGAGQPYLGMQHYHEERKNIYLDILPGNQIKEVYERRFPITKKAVVGSPVLDKWHKDFKLPKNKKPVVAISFHFDRDTIPETMSAFSYYKDIIPVIAKDERWTLLGHGHPRIIDNIIPLYEEYGIEYEKDFDNIMEKADLYICDNSSTIFEFASTNRPVVVLNAPWYRKDVEHGLRFWKYANVGIICNTPEELSGCIIKALHDSPEQKNLRQDIVKEVYEYTDGFAAKRAADSIISSLIYYKNHKDFLYLPDTNFQNIMEFFENKDYCKDLVLKKLNIYTIMLDNCLQRKTIDSQYGIYIEDIDFYYSTLAILYSYLGDKNRVLDLLKEYQKINNQYIPIKIILIINFITKFSLKPDIKQKPLVSVIIPCYNYAKYLVQCVESVINQSLQNFEIIIINDGSTDNSLEIAISLSKKYNKYHITIIDQPNSGDPSVSRNKGIALAEGKYILPLDADDFLLNDALEYMVNEAEKYTYNTMVIYGSIQKFGVLNNIWPDLNIPFNSKALLRQNQLSNTSLFTKEMWIKAGGYTEKIGYEDWDFWIKLLKNGVSFVNIGKIVCMVRTTDNDSIQKRHRKLHEYNFAKIIINNKELYEEIEVTWAKEFLEKFPQPPQERIIYNPNGKFSQVIASMILHSFRGLYSDSDFIWAEKTFNEKHLIHSKGLIKTDSNIGNYVKKINKLLFVCHDFPPYKFAGAQLYAYYLAKALQGMGYHVDIFYPVYESQREFSREKELFSIHKKQYNGLDVYEITVPNQYRTSNDEFDNIDIQNAFYNFLKNSDYDIVHYHLLFRLSARLPLVTKELGIKTVATLHDYWLMCVRGHMIDSQYNECSGPETVEKCSQCQFGKIDQGTCNFFKERQEVTHKGYSAIDYKISPSGFLAEMHSRYSFEKPRILPLGWMTYKKQNRVTDTNCVVFAYLGQIISRKGLDILLNAVNEIDSKNWKLLIYGQIYENWYYDNFKDFIEKHPNIEYCGAYSNDNMDHIFNSFDVFIMPSRRENYPLTLLETLSAGIPSIASDVGGVREMMQDRVEGFVFENGNSKQLSNIMKSIIKSPELVSHLKKNIKPVKTIDDNAKEMEIVYKSLLKK